MNPLDTNPMETDKMSETKQAYPAGITQTDHIAHDMRVGRFPQSSTIEQFLAERTPENEALATTIPLDPMPSAVPDAPQRYTIAHDGFTGTVIGSYMTREGKRGVVLQQDGTRVVHVYGEKWLTPPLEAVPDTGSQSRVKALEKIIEYVKASDASVVEGQRRIHGDDLSDQTDEEILQLMSPDKEIVLSTGFMAFGKEHRPNVVVTRGELRALACLSTPLVETSEVERDWPRLADAEVRLERMIEENVTLRRNVVHERARALKAEEEASSNEAWANSEQDGRLEAQGNLEAATARAEAAEAALAGMRDLLVDFIAMSDDDWSSKRELRGMRKLANRGRALLFPDDALAAHPVDGDGGAA